MSDTCDVDGCENDASEKIFDMVESSEIPVSSRSCQKHRDQVLNAARENNLIFK
jgi:hypothetical protein